MIGVKSNLCIPLAVGGEPPVGCLGLNTLREERAWPDALVKRLQLVAQVFTNALARRRHELEQRESEARLAAGADLAGLAFYEVDFTASVSPSSTSGFAPSAASRRNGRQGLQPVEFWVEQIHPEDRQRVSDQRQQLHDGRLERLSIEYRFLHPAQGEKWIHHVARVADARRRAGARSRRSASSATSRRGGSARRR